MVFRNGNRVIAVLVLAAISTVAKAAPPVEFPAGSNHFYQLVPAAGFTWNAARTAASSMSHQGIQGHLATINSFAEDNFIKQLNNPSGNPKLAWIGGSQDPWPCTPEPGCNWKWINNETIAASNTNAPYTNWRPGEPDDTGSARHLAISDKGGWQSAVPADTWAYIVEYGETFADFAVSACAAVVGGVPGTGCNLTGGGSAGTINGGGGSPGSTNLGAVVLFPPTAIFQQGDEYTVNAWFVTDDRFPPFNELTGRQCGTHSLTFGPLNIPANLCARADSNHQFVVLKTDSDVQIPSGFVTLQVDPTQFGLDEFGCSTPVTDTATLATDQDTAVYATSDPTFMLEHNFDFAANPTISGNVAEVTNHCSRARGGTTGGTWLLIGLAYPSDPDSQDRMLEAALYKAQLLVIAVAGAKAEGALDKATAANMASQAKTIVGDLTNGNNGEGLKHVINFQKFVAAAKIKPADGNKIKRNWQGEFQVRADNLFDVLSRRRIPFED